MKNEKVALVFFAYIIGFTTAFIAFAINDNEYSKKDMAAFKKHPEVVAHTDRVQQNNSGVEVMEREEGLFVLIDGQERVLSATASNGVSGEGFHTEIFSSSVSPSGQYVHFCASLVGEEGLCTNFIYSTEEDMVYRVKVGDEPLIATEEDAGTTSWISGETLSFLEGSASMSTNWTIN